MTNWIPDLSSFSGPRYRALAEAIAAAVANGELAAGQLLPPQREMAYRLGVALGTVTRGYALAESHGHVVGSVGSGTFVRQASIRTEDASMQPVRSIRRTGGSGTIDLTINLPMPEHAAGEVGSMLASLAQSSELLLDDLRDSAVDLRRDHEAAARFLGQNGVRSQANEVAVTVGAQHGLLVSLMALTRPGDALLTEALTYPVVRQLSRHLGLKIHPVAMDREGMVPDALEEEVKRSRAKVLYFMPTLHSPTTTTLSEDRRSRIAEICAVHDVTMIEDDVFRLLLGKRVPTMAEIAPERTVYITSLSKAVAPWLRVGYVKAPSGHVEEIRSAVHSSCWMPPVLPIRLATLWIETGAVEQFSLSQRRELELRQAIARKYLGVGLEESDPEAPHGWLRLPDSWPADEFCAAAERNGVRVLAESVFRCGARTENAVRIGLMRAASLEQLSDSSQILSKIINSKYATLKNVL